MPKINRPWTMLKKTKKNFYDVQGAFFRNQKGQSQKTIIEITPSSISFPSLLSGNDVCYINREENFKEFSDHLEQFILSSVFQDHYRSVDPDQWIKVSRKDPSLPKEFQLRHSLLFIPDQFMTGFKYRIYELYPAMDRYGHKIKGGNGALKIIRNVTPYSTQVGHFYAAKVQKFPIQAQSVISSYNAIEAALWQYLEPTAQIYQPMLNQYRFSRIHINQKSAASWATTIKDTMIIPYEPGIGLYELNNFASITILMRVHIGLKLLKAVKDLHNIGYTHSDLKPENIIVNVKNDGAITVKLVDFGSVNLINTSAFKHKCGTPSFVPTEIMNGTGTYNEKTDVYSLGITLAELFQCAARNKGMIMPYIDVGYIQKFFGDISLAEQISALLLEMLSSDAAKRPTLANATTYLNVIYNGLAQIDPCLRRIGLIDFSVLIYPILIWEDQNIKQEKFKDLIEMVRKYCDSVLLIDTQAYKYLNNPALKDGYSKLIREVLHAFKASCLFVDENVICAAQAIDENEFIAEIIEKRRAQNKTANHSEFYIVHKKGVQLAAPVNSEVTQNFSNTYFNPRALLRK